MESRAEQIRTFILEHIKPKVRVDGGYISVASATDDEVVLLAQADCANCPAGSGCLEWWIGSELKREFGCDIRVVVKRDAPYYAR